jgi:ABC-type multidrug transport system fused ATPase/permease subunit
VNSEDPIVESGVWDAERYVLGVFLLAIFIFLPFMIQSTLFTRVGENITEKIRKEIYHKLLRMPVSWF